MTFLAMAQWQALSLLGLTAAAIIAIFFLRIQHRQVVVSSAILWERVLERRRRRSWLELLRRLLSLLIALAIGLSLMAAFGEAELGSAGREPRDVRIVIDTRPHMAALMGDGRTRLQAARDHAQELLAGGSAADTFSVYDTDGRVVVAATRDRGRARAAVEALVAAGSRFDLPAATSGETWLLTDGVDVPAISADYSIVPVFEPAPNVGVSAFEIRPWPREPRRHEAYLEVGNFSSASQEVSIVLRNDDGVQFRRTLELAAGALYRNTFDLSPLASGVLAAEVRSAGDALDLDDRAAVYVPDQTPVLVALVGRAESPLATLLAAHDGVEMTRMTAPEYEDWAQTIRTGGVGGMAAAADPVRFEGLIFDGYTPAEQPPVATALFGPAAAPWLPARTGDVIEPVLDSHDPDSAVLRYADLHDVHINRAAGVDASGARVLAAAGDDALVLEGGDGGRWIMTTFALTESDFDQRLGFAVFVSNLLEWFRPEEPTRVARLGRVSLDLPNAVVFDAATGDRAAATLLDDRTVFDAPTPGLYIATDGIRRVPVAVRAGGREVSAINRNTLPGDPGSFAAPPAARRLWPVLLGLAAALLLLEGITYHRRITV